MPKVKPQPPAPQFTLIQQPTSPLAIPVEAKLAFTVEEAADLLSIGRSFFYELLAEGRIGVVRLGRRVIVPKTELQAFLDREAAYGPRTED
jgi:excisionase family DNA binding protein